MNEQQKIKLYDRLLIGLGVLVVLTIMIVGGLYLSNERKIEELILLNDEPCTEFSSYEYRKDCFNNTLNDNLCYVASERISLECGFEIDKLVSKQDLIDAQTEIDRINKEKTDKENE